MIDLVSIITSIISVFIKLIHVLESLKIAHSKHLIEKHIIDQESLNNYKYVGSVVYVARLSCFESPRNVLPGFNPRSR